MQKLCITLATRQRGRRVVETIDKSIANWTSPNTVLWVMADHDDPLTAECVHEAQKNKWGDEKVRLSVEQREDTIAEKWNRAVRLAPDDDLYLVAADDDPYITPGYDSKLLEAGKRFPDGIGMVYGRMANASFSGAVCPSRGLVEKMGGKIFPEYFPYWFVDHWTDDIARIIGRISFADIQTDQSNVGKTQELREPAWWATFFDSGALERRRIAHSIIPTLDVPDWLKDMLLTHHPLIEYRSKWINDNVRANAKNLEGWSGIKSQDDRYLRIKAKAEGVVPQFLEGMDATEANRFHSELFPPKVVMGLKRAYA